MTSLLWFKRDLRLADHPALARAATLGPVVPVYIVEPDYWALPDTSARQWAFTAECLAELQADLVALGAPLVIRRGCAVTELDALRRTTGATRLISHEETGNGWTYDRDRAVAAWAREVGVDWEELPQSGVVRRLPSRDGWAARRGRWLTQAVEKTPEALPPHGVTPGRVPSVRDLGLAADPCPARQTGGRRAAEDLLGSFLSTRGRTYRKAMSSPLEGESACSRLSPHLALGTLSGREVAGAQARARADRAGTRDGWLGSLRSFEARLAWRDHFMQKLEDEPRIEWRCLHPAYEDLRPREPDAARLAAWAAGETGLPFVDACMRFLRHTGWLNFRMRSMVTAVASYHLWLDWRATGPILARLFTDYEPGIHWSQIQMQSGTTGMNTIRIYNPVKQGHDQDPAGAFTRRWVPELAAVPDRHLQEPWRWEGAETLLDKGYPAPIVDVARAAKAAREAVWAVRRGDEFRDTARAIIRKHASRKDGPGGHHFVSDRAPSKRRGSGRQMDFGF